MTDGGRGISGDGVPDRGASTTSYRNRPSQRPTRHPSEVRLRARDLSRRLVVAGGWG